MIISKNKQQFEQLAIRGNGVFIEIKDMGLWFYYSPSLQVRCPYGEEWSYIND